MSDSKIQIKIGIVEFSGEGNQDWVSTQLDKILSKVPELLKIELTSNPLGSGGGTNGNKGDQGGNSSANAPSNLPVFLKDKDATTNQVRKFLATAAFLQLNGKSKLNTSDITKALKDATQNKLNNAADCLNQNVKKGHCEKDGDRANGFFVTAHGFEELNIQL